MDLNMLRSLVTVLAFIAFIGIVWWAYHRRSKKRFDDAAQLPFADGDLHDSDRSRGPRR